jgi:hypothetical protein
MSHKRIRILAWGMPVVSAFAGLALFLDWVTHLNGPPDFAGLVQEFGLLVPFLLSVLGALFVTRQHGNTVGWLMIATGFGNVTDGLALLLRTYASAPANITPGLWLIVNLDEISWMFPLFAFFLIPLFFPIGGPPASRWNWIPKGAVALMVSGAFIAAFSPELNPGDGRWSIPNPVALPFVDRISDPFFAVFGIGVLGLVIGSAASLFVRYRRADPETRQQIKWLLAAVGLFVALYVPYGYINGGETTSAWLDLGSILTALAVPAAIALAIFRYRLWDLDVVVNRALVYGPLTTLLAGIFAVLIAVTSALAREFFGAQSQALGAAASAVVVAVIFQPMRTWVQGIVDKRFYPQKQNLDTGLVEVQPEYWAFLTQAQLLRIAGTHVRKAMGVAYAAFNLSSDGSTFRLQAEQAPSGGEPARVKLTLQQRDELHRKRVAANEDRGPAAGFVPVYIDRGEEVEVLGLMAVGARTNGRGYSGDDLKALADLGGEDWLGAECHPARRGGRRVGSEGADGIDRSVGCQGHRREVEFHENFEGRRTQTSMECTA